MLNFISWILFLFAIATAQSVNSNMDGSVLKDGTYTGNSKAQYSYEPFEGRAVIQIRNQNIVEVNFQIIDTQNNEVFGSDYEKHYPDNKLYQEQCRNDWKGMKLYQQELLDKQNIDSVDAVSGATWSYNIFKASVKKALGE